LVGRAILSRPCGELHKQGSLQNRNAYGYASLPVISPSIGAGGAFVPEAFKCDGLRFFRDAATVLINLFGEEIHCRRPDLLGLLIGSAQFSFFWGPVEVDEGDVVRHSESILPHPGQDRAVVGEDGVGLFLFHPGDDGCFVELVDEEGLDFG